MEEKTTKPTGTQVVKEIRRNPRRKFSAKEEINVSALPAGMYMVMVVIEGQAVSG